MDLDSIAPVGSPLRTIDELVESLNTREIEKVYDLDPAQGQNPFHPKTFIKVALYAIHSCRFSLRKMQQDTTNHLGYGWLTGDRSLDHSTIGYFLGQFHPQVVEEQKIRRRLGELLRGVEKGREAEEREALEYRQARLVEAKEVLEKRIAEEAAGKSEKEAEQIVKKEKIDIPDYEAAIMAQANEERNPAYWVTTGTDVGGDIVTHFQVNEKDNDSRAL